MSRVVVAANRPRAVTAAAAADHIKIARASRVAIEAVIEAATAAETAGAVAPGADRVAATTAAEIADQAEQAEKVSGTFN